MVTDLFEYAGWDTYYVGGHAPEESVIASLRKRPVDVLGISTNLTTRVSEVRDLIASVRSDPEVSQVKILVGGRPFNRDPGLWLFVGADAVASNAAEAVEKGSELIESFEDDV
jgi:methanogenic corrinoid protein MtbC1